MLKLIIFKFIIYSPRSLWKAIICLKILMHCFLLSKTWVSTALYFQERIVNIFQQATESDFEESKVFLNPGQTWQTSFTSQTFELCSLNNFVRFGHIVKALCKKLSFFAMFLKKFKKHSLLVTSTEMFVQQCFATWPTFCLASKSHMFAVQYVCLFWQGLLSYSSFLLYICVRKALWKGRPVYR